MSNWLNLSVKEDRDKIDMANKLLAGIPKGTQKAVGSTLKRTITAAKAQASKSLRQEYSISAADLKANLIGKSFVNAEDVELLFIGKTIPLSKYRYKIGGDGKVAVNVKKGNGWKTLNRAFVVDVGGHTGIFERNAHPRLPINQFIGPSPPYMLDANDKVKKEIEDKVHETFNKRIDHEIMAILNGLR